MMQSKPRTLAALVGNIFVRTRGKQYGPFSKHELRDLVKKGQFTAADLVWHPDLEEWIEAAKIEELREIFPQVEAVPKQRRVIAIGGGKGGVGKTVVTASLGVGLAALGYRVVMVDADLAGANLHTCMGILEPEYTFYDFYTLRRERLEDIILDTPVANLQMISGACGTLGLANPRYWQKVKLINQLRDINADFILLDLGAGASYNVIDFFLASDEGIAVTVPDPMAVQECFNFLKICLLRKLRLTFRNEPQVLKLLEQDELSHPGLIRSTMAELLKEMQEVDAHAAEVCESVLQSFRPRLLMNMVYEQEEVRDGMAIKAAAAELLSLDVDFLGYIEYDDSVRESAKRLRPFILNDPRSKASRSLAKIIAVKILGKEGWEGRRLGRRLRKEAKESAQEYPEPTLGGSETICSVRCFYWGDCEYQNGGHPCSVRSLEPMFRHR
ncbi:MAG: P-loop NTPase [candidate division KSB1 bacterium]|nr:P-loop NTPase [candidate division KSB1 bacterium]MDZ7385404.1 P-loop NTPase [candidate division KSB1 bacterium]MDZ7391926.1 P-loop NTPase [candidate division KSB1 bacterium]MDZ7414216.1 P-loop NTPase [candidate division KSB1 bacterium]